MSILTRRTSLGIATAVAVGLATLMAGTPTANGHGDPDMPVDALARAPELITPGPAWRQAMKTENFTVVGHTDLGGGGLNADVWLHGDYAYVGVWSGPCPATGVKVVDVSTPNSPAVVARLQNPIGTSAEDVVVRSVDTPSFTGDLAVVGIQACDDEPGQPAPFRGLEFWDVTDPASPNRLSEWESPFGGCHEVDMAIREDGSVLAGCAEPFAEQVADADEVNVVDVTDPTNPEKVAGFALGRDAGIDPGTTRQNVGCFPASFAHSVRFTNGGRALFASYWDVGTIKFRVESDGSLTRLSRADIAPPDEDGDNHSMTLARGGTVQLINPEDNCVNRRGGSGEVHVVTNTDRPRHVSTFSTPNSRSRRTDGDFTVHNTEVFPGGIQAMSSWYSDGVVWWSLANRERPRMRGQFVPPPTEDPSGFFPPVPLVWGVALDRTSGLVYASDINSGLWIIRPTGLRLN